MRRVSGSSTAGRLSLSYRFPKAVGVKIHVVKKVVIDCKSAIRSEFFDHGSGVLLRDLHKDRFPLLQLKAAVQRRDLDGLFFAADQEAARRAFDRTILCVVREFTHVKIRAQLTVD